MVKIFIRVIVALAIIVMPSSFVYAGEANLVQGGATPTEKVISTGIGGGIGFGGTTAGSVALISSSGTVTGLSGAGITSGLTAIGGTMIGGVVVVSAAVVIGTVVTGYVGYRVIKWWMA